ncbi:hypothetical protein BJ508DRAFT_331053 [Ascobolus immersus RN42]|uniref:F-box domain-containing protein n=1 Tax=Ascobolus immersus RN42 TaxID=1160509 RepID=A0A3N4HRM7_ASCIM|nr:hypothetical protein BJ508DRAFT_331053 [Ascobolus immersus RN42]
MPSFSKLPNELRMVIAEHIPLWDDFRNFAHVDRTNRSILTSNQDRLFSYFPTSSDERDVVEFASYALASQREDLSVLRDVLEALFMAASIKMPDSSSLVRINIYVTTAAQGPTFFAIRNLLSALIKLSDCKQFPNFFSTVEALTVGRACARMGNRFQDIFAFYGEETHLHSDNEPFLMTELGSRAFCEICLWIERAFRGSTPHLGFVEEIQDQ